MLILLAVRIGADSTLENYISKCKAHFPYTFHTQIDFLNKREKSMDSILKKYSNGLEKAKLEDFLLNPGLINQQNKVIEFFFQVIKEEKNTIKKRIAILKTIQNQPEGIFQDLLELSVALDSDNQAWSKKLTKKIINLGPWELLFSRVIETPELQNKAREGLKIFLAKFNKTLKDEMLRKMLDNHISNLFQSENSRNQNFFWSNDWTLSEKRNFLWSTNYGRPFIGFWFLELIAATHEAEVMQFLKEVLNKDIVMKYGKTFSWLFTFYPIKNLEPELILVFKEIWNSDSSYNKFLVLILMENQAIKNLLVKEIPELSKPTFQLKRELLFKMLRRGENLYFSIYQLLKLGDRSEELLWWVTFAEK